LSVSFGHQTPATSVPPLVALQIVPPNGDHVVPHSTSIKRVARTLVVAAALASAGCGSGASKPAKTTTRASSPAVASLASLGTLVAPPSPGPFGPEGVPIPAVAALASRASSANGTAVDGIQCLGSEQTLFHIHAHLTLFLGGAARQLPAGIGITKPQIQSTPEGPFVAGGGCFYWLHTHAADGVIHIESPVQRTFTLGNFFDVWGQPLSPTQVGPASGKVTAIYNGKLYTGNPRNIPLNAHAQIQLEVAAPLVAPVTIAFPAGL
jgi:hypothetical protein